MSSMLIFCLFFIRLIVSNLASSMELNGFDYNQMLSLNYDLILLPIIILLIFYFILPKLRLNVITNESLEFYLNWFLSGWVSSAVFVVKYLFGIAGTLIALLCLFNLRRNKCHFCEPCHTNHSEYVGYDGVNKKKIWEYTQCPGLRERIDEMRADKTIPEAELEVGWFHTSKYHIDIISRRLALLLI